MGKVLSGEVSCPCDRPCMYIALFTCVSNSLFLIACVEQERYSCFYFTLNNAGTSVGLKKSLFSGIYSKLL